MDFIETIIKHYLRESQQGFGAAIFGGILLIIGILLLRFANPLSLLKGLTIPFFLVGIIMGLGGTADGYLAHRSISEKTTLYKNDRKAFFEKESKVVEKTHHSWGGIRLRWGILSLAGIGLLLGARSSYWSGVAIGTIIVSMAGHIEEAISKNYNEEYYHQVLDEYKKSGLFNITPPLTIRLNKTLPDSIAIKMEHHQKAPDRETLSEPGILKSDGFINLHLETNK